MLFLGKPRPFPGWGESGSRHSRNIFSVSSLVILKPHLRVERSGSKIEEKIEGGGGMWVLIKSPKCSM